MSSRATTAPIVTALSALIAFGCASTQAHYNLVTLKDQAEFESNCSKDRIEVVDAQDVNPNQTAITLSVCGQRQQWQRLGINYFPMGQGLSGARSH